MTTQEALQYMEYELDYLTCGGQGGGREVAADKVAIIALREKLAREIAQAEKQEEQA